jgi:N-methylhydantoinase A
VLGYLDPGNFLGGEMALRVDLAEAALGRIAEKLNMTIIDVARGIANIVNESMATAARVHIAEKGHDPRRFTMVATGGAGPVHAIEVARKLRIRRVLAGIAAGAGSCLGFLAASARVDRSWSRPALLAEVDWPEVAGQLQNMRASISEELTSAGVDVTAVNWALAVEMRYAGQGHTCIVDVPAADAGPALSERLLALFEERYRGLYGRTVPNGLPEVATWRLSGRSEAQSRRFAWNDGNSGGKSAAPAGRRQIYLPLKNAFGEAPVYDRYALPPGTKFAGPAILQERESTFVIPVPAEITILDDLTVSVELEAE